MKIDVYLTPDEMPHGVLRDSTAAVIDVLRASSSIVTAMSNGAKRIHPCESVAAALGMAKKLGKGKVLLCGERNGKKVKGFDLGNSPFEFTTKAVADKDLILATTNGTKAMAKVKGAKTAMIASFLNIDAAAERVVAEKRDLVIICSGRESYFSLEDTVCAGMLIFCVERHAKVVLGNDVAQAAFSLFKDWILKIKKMLKASDHGKYLNQIGFGKDLDYCAEINRYHTVPIIKRGTILSE